MTLGTYIVTADGNAKWGRSFDASDDQAAIKKAVELVDEEKKCSVNEYADDVTINVYNTPNAPANQFDYIEMLDFGEGEREICDLEIHETVRKYTAGY